MSCGINIKLYLVFTTFRSRAEETWHAPSGYQYQRQPHNVLFWSVFPFFICPLIVQSSMALTIESEWQRIVMSRVLQFWHWCTQNKCLCLHHLSQGESTLLGEVSIVDIFSIIRHDLLVYCNVNPYQCLALTIVGGREKERDQDRRADRDSTSFIGKNRKYSELRTETN